MKYTFTQENFVAVLKVIGWSVAASIVASLIMILEETAVPVQYAFLVPLVNSSLYALKEFISDKR